MASEWAGFTTVGQCEWADYPTKVLEKHWPDVPRWRDVRDVTAESVRGRGIGEITLLSGGFPCQPFSVAGKQRGKEDDRYLWPEMLRVIEELRPRWVIGENVAGIVRLALDQVLTDLEGKGYTAIPFIIPACGVGAHHRRERVWIIAFLEHPADNGQFKLRKDGGSVTESNVSRRSRESKPETEIKSEYIERTGTLSEDVANTDSLRMERQGAKQQTTRIGRESENVADSESGGISKHITEGKGSRGSGGSGWWDVEPDVGRVVAGIPSRVDRLKCLGNAVVPQQCYPILKAIAEIESEKFSCNK